MGTYTDFFMPKTHPHNILCPHYAPALTISPGPFKRAGPYPTIDTVFRGVGIRNADNSPAWFTGELRDRYLSRLNHQQTHLHPVPPATLPLRQTGDHPATR